MKRIFALILVLITVLALCACQKDTQPQEETTAPAVSGKPTISTDAGVLEDPADLEDPESKPTEPNVDLNFDTDADPDELRSGLKQYYWNGLTYYIHEDYREIWRDESGIAYSNDGWDLHVEGLNTAEINWLQDVNSAEDLAKAMVAQYGSESSRYSIANGTYFVFCEGSGEAAGEGSITGCYVKDGYAWVIAVEICDLEGITKEELLNYINYATLGAVA